MFRKLAALWHSIAAAHRSEDETGAGAVSDFFLPKINRRSLARAGIVAVLAVIVFGFILIPCSIDGESMAPTFPGRGFTFCWRGKYLFSKPKLGDVVILRYTDRVYYLKRIVGLPGDTIEFREGKLYRNGTEAREPYVRYMSNWELPPRVVSPGHYYVVGDNRGHPLEMQLFGEVRADRIAGAPLF